MSVIKTAFNLYFPSASGLPGATAAANGGKHTMGWLNVSYDDVLTGPPWVPPQDWSWSTSLADTFKATREAFRCGLYISGSLSPVRTFDPAYEWTTNAQSLHTPAGAQLVYTNAVPHDYLWVNYNDAGVRDDHIARYLTFLEEKHFDAGLFLDSWSPIVYSWWINGNSALLDFPGGVREGPAHTTAYWVNWLATWSTQLRDALEAEGHMLVGNGLGPLLGLDAESDAFLGPYTSNVGLYTSCAIYELPHRMYKNGTVFAEAIDGTRSALATGAEVWWWVQPHFFTITDPLVVGVSSTIDYTLGPDLERFYLATYLLIATDRTYFGYHDKIEYRGWDPDNGNEPYVFWSDDFERDYGEPTGREFRTVPETLRWRQFTRGYSVVNPTSTSQNFTVPGTYRRWDAVEGGQVRVTRSDPFEVPAYTGVYLAYPRRAA